MFRNEMTDRQLDDALQPDGFDLGGTPESFKDFIDLFDASTIGTALVDHDPQWNAVV